MEKILLTMSGGIDSSVCGILLKEQGYDISAITYRTYDTISESCISKQTGCCSIESMLEAKRFAEQLGISHQIVDFREKFKSTIIDNFIAEYTSGRTPNPCVNCNLAIKWGQVISIAKKLNCTKIATGHYAQVKYQNGRYFLSSGIDKTKDQTYFLWRLTQDDLAQTIFPIGSYTKNEIRKIANDRGFEKLSKKKESQEICFIPDNDYRRFLNDMAPEIIKKLGQGDFVLSNGKVVGKHNGYPFYTIGQRKGLNIALGEPYYVIDINPTNNKITLGKRNELEVKQTTVRDINLMKYQAIPPEGLEVTVKIRYRTPPEKAIIYCKNDTITVNFENPVTAVTPGQSAVFYEEDDVVGGGIIQKTNN